ncbi:MAG: hypothetical protein BWY70_00473 [Bacteroidetes bacterium ADurb.Bin408]|nr:MAG: hypothetical protein BWY70_00473 [Bacteroidetes bacterium ADurb.Bin408]
MIQECINNPNKDVYITMGNTSGVYGKMYRDWNDKGDIKSPNTIDIGNISYIGDNYDEDGKIAIPEFMFTIIDKSKENYFITLSEEVFGKENLFVGDKKGAKVLGHEKGAHTKNKKSGEGEEDIIWGQGTYEKKPEPGSSAEILNTQIDKAKKRNTNYQLKDMGRGKFKLEEKRNEK